MVRLSELIDLEILTIGLFIFYGIAILFLICYGLMQIHLVYHYLKCRKVLPTQLPSISYSDTSDYPLVTVQLPVYNEKHVMDRIIDAVASFKYPSDRLEIQVLDDSTDETVEIIRNRVNYWQAQGIDIQHIRRAHRHGFKAGALQEGLQVAKGEYIAIFDADFVPEQEFLLKTLSGFGDDYIGMVQTRWDHLNKGYSLLTRLQTFLLDAHFSIEQKARNACGYFMNFSGTGGIWRKRCIEEAGEWHSDTLTEDFDLSYRAQLKGWKFRYLEEVSTPAELPPVMSAFKTQHYRWIKGIAETSKKHIPNIMKAKVGLPVKIHAILHLLIGVVFVSAFVCSILSVPLLYLKQFVPQFYDLYLYSSFSLISLLCLGFFHCTATLYSKSCPEKNALGYFFKNFPIYLSFSMGISLHNAIAVIDGWTGKKTVFKRTPKFNLSVSQKELQKQDLLPSLTKLNYLELAMAVYFMFGAYLGITLADFTMLPYHLMLISGFLLISYFSLAEVISACRGTGTLVSMKALRKAS
jgi:cellulose synthase/poly-beta-1,6-N-acetylglucosamine synthase-like glycosyltransferase